MKLQGNGNVLATSGLTNPTHQFKIQATAKAFQILSSGLYSDKITAIIREISTNAYDAHVVAGKATVPFAVHLPNQFEPWFEVSDQGTGLSEEDIFEIYTTYFQSTKQEDNETVGALGLGSKSPFSYVNQFTVVSHHGGERKTYTAFLTEEGMPTIVKIGEAELTDRTGIDVKFGVKPNDYYEFLQKAAKVYRYFTVRPNIVGAKLSVPVLEHVIKGTNWAMRKEGGQSMAVQGTVAYPIPSITGFEDVLGLGLDVHFAIGDIEISASRESISMNKQTTANIKDRLVQIRGELVVQATKDIESATSYWDAVGKYTALLHSSMSHLIHNSKIEWQGRVVEDGIKIQLTDYPAVNFVQLSRSAHRRVVSEAELSSYIWVRPDPDLLFVEGLEKRGNKSLVRKWLKDPISGAISQVIVFSHNRARDENDVFIHDDKTYEENLNSLMTLMGGPTFSNTETLRSQLPTRVKGVRDKVSRTLYRVFSGCSSKWMSSWSEATDTQLDADVKYYIKTSYSSPELLLSKKDPQDLSSLIRILDQMGVLESTVVFEGSNAFLRDIDRDKENREQWVDLQTVVDQAVEKAKADTTLQNLTKVGGLSCSGANVYDWSSQWERKVSSRTESHPFVTLYKQLKSDIAAGLTAAKTLQPYWNLGTLIGKTVISGKDTQTCPSLKYKTAFATLMKSYPLVSWSNSWTATDLDVMLEYMVAMDEFRAKKV
jgi:hypothetical protein